MEFEKTYCYYAAEDPVHRAYHEFEHGFPISSDDGLFERLILEINQAGLSWATVLRKRDGLRAAYAAFSIDAVAAFDDRDRARLMADASIIRNRLKIDSAIDNARRIQAIQREHGSFAGWLDSLHPRSKAEWVKDFKKKFRFTGGEIVGEFLMSSGYLPGAHHLNCPIEQRVRKMNPAWVRSLAAE